MAKVIVEDSNLKRVADAIRSKNGETEEYKLSQFSSKIDEMNIATPVTKGFIINSFDEDGYPTDASIVGMTKIPDYYFYHAAYVNGSNKGWLANIGNNLHLPDKLTSIGKNAFLGCTNLALTSLPNTLITLSDGCFRECTNLVLTELPSSLTEIKVDCFRDCKNLILTKLPENLTKLGIECFYSCTKLTLTELPASITDLPYGTFNYCDSITEMTIKGNITSIGAYAFNKTNLSKLVLLNITTIPSLSSSALNNTPIASKKGYIYVPDALVEDFKVASNWSTYASQIKGVSELEAQI